MWRPATTRKNGATPKNQTSRKLKSKKVGKFIKIVLIVMFFAISGLSNIANAQNIQAYSDATIDGRGFSYNVQLSITPLENNEVLHAGGWIVKLISVNPDSKGYYHKGKTNRYFSCSELGSICNPSKFDMVLVKVKYQCENNAEKLIVFYGIDREETIVVRQKPNTKCSIELESVKVRNNADEPKYRKRIKEIEYPQQNTSATTSNIPSSSSSNPVTQSGSSSEVYINGQGNTPSSGSSNSTTNTGTTPSGNEPLAHFKEQENNNTQTNSSGAELAQAVQIQKNKDDYAARVAASEAKAERNRLAVESTVQIMNAAAPLIEEWAAERERKWAAERAAYARHQSIVDDNKIAYSNLVASTNNFLFQNQNNYQTMLNLSLPDVLTLPPITWEEALGTADYNGYFGKDVSFVSKKTRERSVFLMGASLTADLKNDKVEKVSLPTVFTHQELKVVDHDNSMYYWVKTDFFDHNTEFIFDNNNIMVGTRLILHTDYQEGQIHIKDYYDDLIKNIGTKYFMASGNTFVTNDKIFVLDFNHLDIYDLNYLDPNTFFNFPKEFKYYFNPDNCLECINQIGIKIQGTKLVSKKLNEDVEIKQVFPNSLAEQNNLLPGDIILKINDIPIKHPYHVQWYFQGFPNEKTINLKIKRANKIENILINL